MTTVCSNMKKIKLTKGKYAIVDDEDYEFLSLFKWYCSNYGYACRGTQGHGKVYMHRAVIDTPKGLHTDHINRDRLDNRKENLRVCTIAQNQWNRPNPINNTSGRKGIYWNKNTRMWQVQINFKGKPVYFGSYKDKEQAIKIREEAEDKYHKGFSYNYA